MQFFQIAIAGASAVLAIVPSVSLTKNASTPDIRQEPDAQVVSAPCKKEGAIQTTKGKLQICTKVENKLVWSIAKKSDATTKKTRVLLSCANGGACAVGSKGPGGGIVFHVDWENKYPVWQYLELAPTLAAASVDGQKVGLSWYQAARAATSYETKLANDWFLPSFWELSTAVKNLFYLPSVPIFWSECASEDKLSDPCSDLWTSTNIGPSYALVRGPEFGEIPEGQSKDSDGEWQQGAYGIGKKFTGDPEKGFGKVRELSALLPVIAVRGFKSKVSLTTEVLVTNPKSPSVTSNEPTRTSQVAYKEPTQPSEAIGICELTDKSKQRAGYNQIFSGFPPTPEFNLPRRGVFKVALVPVDWADIPGEANPVARVADQMKTYSSFWEMVSGGRLKLEWVTANNYVRMNGASSYWTTARSFPGNDSFAREAIRAADPYVDFTDVHAVWFLVPKIANRLVFPDGTARTFDPADWTPGTTFSTNEGVIRNYGLAGGYFDQPLKTYWSAWSHFTGGHLGLPELFDEKQNNGKQIDPLIPVGSFSGFDIMSIQDGPTRTLAGWMRFLVGWLSESQIYCKDINNLSTTTLDIIPINSDLSGVKLALVKITDTLAVAIESRRPDERFDCLKQPNRSGIIVYVVNTTRGHVEGDLLSLVSPVGRSLASGSPCFSPPQIDAVLKVGDFVSSNGVKIKVIRSGVFDTVEVSK